MNSEPVLRISVFLLAAINFPGLLHAQTLPPVISKQFLNVPSPFYPGQTATLQLTVTNPNVSPAPSLPAPALTVSFTDTFPSGLVVATPTGLGGTCASFATGAVGALAGSNGVSMSGTKLAGGGVPGLNGSSCTVIVNVMANGANIGTLTNVTGVTSAEAGAGSPALAMITVTPLPPTLPPVISKQFSNVPSPFYPGQTATLQLTVTNPNVSPAPSLPAPALTVSFTDTFPSGLVVATPTGLGGTCASFATGAVGALAGSNGVSMSGTKLAGGGVPGLNGSSCTVIVNVMANGANIGTLTNVTGVTSAEAGAGSPALAVITVTPLPPTLPPVISKQFSNVPSPFYPGQTATLQLTVTNPNVSPAPSLPAPALTVSFTDTFPSGLVVATPTGLGGTCASFATGAVGALAGSNGVSMSGTKLAGGGVPGPNGSSCTVIVNVMANGANIGTLTNVTGVTSAEAGAGSPALAVITVTPLPPTLPPVISKQFSNVPSPFYPGQTATLQLTVTNPNVSPAPSLPAPALTVSFTDTFPSGLVVATPTGLGGTCASFATGAVGALAGSNGVSMSGTKLAGGGVPGPNGSSCTVIVNVMANGASIGLLTNITGVTSVEGGPGNQALATVTVFTGPRITKAFGAATIPLNQSTSLSFNITSVGFAGSLSGVGFTDNLPSGLIVSTPAGLTGSCNGGTISATPGSQQIVLSGAIFAPAAVCNFSVNVTGVMAGVQNNVTSPVTSNETGPGNVASATLTVIAPPSITKTFSPIKFLPGGTSTVSFVITNPNSFTNLTGVAFTDSLPSGLVVATPNGLTSTCGGTATATAGSGTISLSGGSIASSGTCTVTATVTAPEGIYLNSVTVTSTNGGTGNTSVATVFVATPPNLSKVFGELSIGSGGSTTLTFTLMNPNHVVTLHGLQFSDTLPAGLVISTPNGLAGSCDGGTITAPAGSNLIAESGATLAPQASCTFSVNVSSDGTVLGYVINTTSTVTSTEALAGAAASATLFIGNPFQFTYAANLNVGEAYIDIGNVGTNGVSLLGPGFGGATGNLCVNVYAFDPGEELIACCSCLITPDQTVNLGVIRDLTVKTLTGVVPTSVTVAALSTLAGGTGTGTSCLNSAATVASATLANGMAAWGTTLHATPTAAYGTTERPFSGAVLNAGELASLGGRCASILGNGSGFGVCNSCKAGGLGAAASQQ